MGLSLPSACPEAGGQLEPVVFTRRSAPLALRGRSSRGGAGRLPDLPLPAMDEDPVGDCWTPQGPHDPGSARLSKLHLSRPSRCPFSLCPAPQAVCAQSACSPGCPWSYLPPASQGPSTSSWAFSSTRTVPLSETLCLPTQSDVSTGLSLFRSLCFMALGFGLYLTPCL